MIIRRAAKAIFVDDGVDEHGAVCVTLVSFWPCRSQQKNFFFWSCCKGRFFYCLESLLQELFDVFIWITNSEVFFIASWSCRCESLKRCPERVPDWISSEFETRETVINHYGVNNEIVRSWSRRSPNEKEDLCRNPALIIWIDSN